MKPGNTRKALRESTAYVDLGLRLALIELIGVWGGWKLDQKFSTTPWLTILGVLGGFSIGLYWFIMALRDLIHRQENTDD